MRTPCGVEPSFGDKQWELKRKELELVAARNFTKMRLDLVGQYRFRGFGDDLVGGDAPNSSAFSDLLTGNLQGGQIGVELTTPVGNRIGHTAVRHAQLEVKRQRDLYSQQQLRVEHEVSHAFSQLARSYALTRTHFNRSQAAIAQWRAISDKYQRGVQDPQAPEILPRKRVGGSKPRRAGRNGLPSDAGRIQPIVDEPSSGEGNIARLPPSVSDGGTAFARRPTVRRQDRLETGGPTSSLSAGPLPHHSGPVSATSPRFGRWRPRGRPGGRK